MKQIWMYDFCTEMRLTCDGETEEIWLIFVYGSTDVKDAQWDFLKAMKHGWGKYWVIGGDFNDIRNHVEKQGEKERKESSFWPFRNFIADMEMGRSSIKGIIIHGLTIERGKFSFRRGWIGFLGLRIG